MFDFHEKRKIRQLVYSKYFIGVLFLIGLLISRSAYERYVVENEMAEKTAEKSAEYAKLQERAALLESKLSHLENNRGIEEELRNRFDVAKDGEKVVIIVEKPDSKETKIEPINQSAGKERESQSWWSTFMFWKN